MYTDWERRSAVRWIPKGDSAVFMTCGFPPTGNPTNSTSVPLPPAPHCATAKWDEVEEDKVSRHAETARRVEAHGGLLTGNPLLLLRYNSHDPGQPPGQSPFSHALEPLKSIQQNLLCREGCLP
eukprot:331053-Rhodomonas_salina.9